MFIRAELSQSDSQKYIHTIYTQIFWLLKNCTIYQRTHFLTFRDKIALSIEQCRATKERGSLKHNEAKVGKSCLFGSGKVACSGMSI